MLMKRQKETLKESLGMQIDKVKSISNQILLTKRTVQLKNWNYNQLDTILCSKSTCYAVLRMLTICVFTCDYLFIKYVISMIIFLKLWTTDWNLLECICEKALDSFSSPLIFPSALFFPQSGANHWSLAVWPQPLMKSPSLSPAQTPSFDLVTSSPLCHTLISHSKSKDPQGAEWERGAEDNRERVRGCQYIIPDAFECVL